MGADYKNFSSCSPLENQVINQVEYKKVSSNDQLENYILFTEKEGYIEAISYLLNKSEDNSSSESMESNAVDDTKCLEGHAINQVDNKEYNATKNRKAVSLNVATTEVISHQPIQCEDDSSSENKESNFVEGTKTFKKSAINDVECRKSSSIDS